MTRKQLLLAAAGCVLAFGLGFVVGRLAPPLFAKGGYFCCDQTGKPCVYSPDGDCKVPLTWCSEIREVNGTVTCAVW